MKGIPAPAGVRTDVTNLTGQRIFELAAWREAVYWLYSANGQLLYVGRAGSVGSRLPQHRRDKAWWPQVTCRVVAWYATYTEAKSAEALAIFQEKPLHNKRPEPLPISDPRAPGGWLHMVSAEAASRQLENLINDTEGHGLHVGIKGHRNRSALAAVLVPVDWYEEVKAKIAEKEEKS